MIPAPPIDGIAIGDFKIYFYGILIMLGALAATWLAARRAVQYIEDPELAWDLLPWALVGGIIGARLWHILTPPASMLAIGRDTAYYLRSPLEMLNIRNGGLGIPGGVIGGFLAAWIYLNRKERSILKWADIAAPGVALAQAVGRLGNYFNQELYGGPTSLPWRLQIVNPETRQLIGYFHPLFLYELLWNLLNAGLLIWLSKRFRNVLRRGDLFLIYLVFYGVGRFLLEYLRLDPSPVAGINANQTLMAVITVVSLAILFLRRRLLPNEPTSIPVNAAPKAPAGQGEEAPAESL